jgi:transposase-like protein
MECLNCKGSGWKYGKNRNGTSRFRCKDCGKTWSDSQPKYSEDDKRRATEFYLNNCGIRKTALFIGCSPATILNWLREAAAKLPEPKTADLGGDVVEMDEIWARTDKRIAQKNAEKAVSR